MEDNIVFAVDSYNKTPGQAAQEYAESWPDGERKIEWLSIDRFRFTDGTRDYCVKYERPIYKIIAL